MASIDETMLFSAADLKKEHLKITLKEVAAALDERGYDPVSQISGYLMTNDPAYISSYKDSRLKIQQVERYELLEEIVRCYLESK